MFTANTLTFTEFIMHETLPLVTIQNGILEFLQGRDDVVLFGAQAVNAYVAEPRMSQDIDLVSTEAETLAEVIRQFLNQTYHVAVRVRKVAQGRGFRIYQVQAGGNRHLVDIRQAEQLPQAQRIGQILVMTPPELIASKVIAYHRRKGQPKSGTDWRDLMMLLLRFPELKQAQGMVLDRLWAAGADKEVTQSWLNLVSQPFDLADDDDEF